ADKLLMLIDPAGFRWLNETHLKVDRGVAYYNTASIPLDPLIVANRLGVLLLGFGAVALSRRHFSATLRGAPGRAERRWAAASLAEGRGGASDPSPGAAVIVPVRTLAA